MKKINVTQAYLPNKEIYFEYINQIFKDGWITNNGKLVQELQYKLEKYLGVKHILLVSSGTMALQIAYKLLKLKGEVITTPFSFVATTSSLVWEGLETVFADINPMSLNIDSKNIEKLITKNTSAIVPVHIFGNACEIEKIQEIADKYHLKIIYDGAHAFNVKYKNKSVLNYGDITTLSFHATKLFHTIEGGALIINDDALYLKAKKMINFGINETGFVDTLGINAKMNEFEAAMGLSILDDLELLEKGRKKIYNYYKENLKNIVRLPQQNINSQQNYSYFPIILNSEKELLQISQALNNENIYPKRYFYPSLDTLPFIEQTESLKISRCISEKILALPLYPALELNIQNKIIQIIIKNINADL